ncbi:AI-2E family transporter [Sulfurifustis variabilis]|uniref:AI-2E family transporter n=1 Tax=Sulfurifustis variabilis TaxID=1675686 RepID=UPI000BBAF9C0|nr:AI-2E family transporter [Sulfurifustis variabilis]
MKPVTSRDGGGTNDSAGKSARVHHDARSGDDRVRGWVLTALFVLAVFYTLYLTRDLTLPIVLALLLALLLLPLVRWLRLLRLPAPVAAALVVFALLGGLAYIVLALSEPASAWLQKAPQIMGELERKLRPIKQKVEEVEKAAQQVERATGAERGRTVEVRGTGLRDMVLARIQQLLGGGLVMFFLLYFLLSTGDGLRARLASLASSNEGRANVLEIAHRVERAISSYLSTVTLINAGLGLLTALLMYLLGMPNPALWGALAALLNFIPYIGALTTTVVLAIVAMLTFDELGRALLVPGAFLILTSLEGQVVTPLLLGKQLELNPVVIFLGLIFWGWLWGVVGALLAVPILVALKIACDHVRLLQPLGHVLAR